MKIIESYLVICQYCQATMADRMAAEYVEAIMSSQSLLRVETPRSDRKRKILEASGADYITFMKSLSYLGENTRETPQSMYLDDFVSLISFFSAALKMQFSALNDRMDKMENRIEQKI